MQVEMGLLQDVKTEPEFASWELVNGCKGLLQAAQLSVQLSGRTHESIAEDIGMNKGNFSRFLSGQSSIPFWKLTQFIRATGYLAILQWLANHFGYDLVKKTDKDRIKELEEQLDYLRRTG